MATLVVQILLEYYNLTAKHASCLYMQMYQHHPKDIPDFPGESWQGLEELQQWITSHDAQKHANVAFFQSGVDIIWPSSNKYLSEELRIVG